jgi:Gluconate 2-dehydrogenase subunit 3
MSLQRREFFAILGACTLGAERLFAQHEHHFDGAAPDFAAYQPKAFTTAEYKLLDELLESLLPADETGPGAHDAHVAYYIDVVLSHASGGPEQSWRNGLAKVEQLANDSFRQPFGACSAPQRQEVLALLAKNEMAPLTDVDRFFVEFKRTAIDGFYASELIQREHLGYKGNTAIAEFAGCTHLNFEHPDIA